MKLRKNLLKKQKITRVSRLNLFFYIIIILFVRDLVKNHVKEGG
jgi:hypothetical protein